MSISSRKTAPQKKTIVRGVTILLAYGHFKWSESDGFRMGAHESGRFKAFFDKAVKDGRIKIGSWQRRTWIGFAVLSRLVSTFLSRGIERGTVNWDITIAKCLSVVLVAALGARSGDVAQSRHYKGEEYVQYRHIDLHIDGDQPTLANLRATVTLEFEKGHKMADNEESDLYFSPLGENSHMCPIAWLLVHALRHSLVAGTTLQDVLDRAFARTDRKVEWLYPSRPVLAAFQVGNGPLRVDLDKAAGTDQLLQTIKEMGVAAGMLDRAYVHALRLGSARDISQLPAEAVVGFDADRVRQSLGHTSASAFTGVTERYVGGSSAELWSHRAQSSTQPKGKLPQFATPAGEVESRQTTAERLTGGPTPLPEIAAPSRRPLANMDVNTPASSRRAAHPLQNVDPALLTEEQLAEVTAAVTTSAAAELRGMIFPEAASGSEPEPEQGDFALDSFNAADAQAALDSVADESGLEEDEALFVAEGNPAAEAYSGPEEFVACYSFINVVDSYYLGRAWQSSDDAAIEKAMQSYCISGGSRGDPAPMQHKCSKTPGCTYREYTRDAVRLHEERCSPERMDQIATSKSKLAEAAKHACPYEDCDYLPAPDSERPASLLALHIKDKHGFNPKACEFGCEPDKLYYELSKYKYHISTAHSSQWPARCTYPGCTHQTQYVNPTGLKAHLKTTHKLEDFDELAKYLPAPDPKRKYVPNQQCWIGDCTVEPKDRPAMTSHLKSAQHKMSHEDAKAAIEANAEFELVVEQRKQRKKRAVSAKEVERSEGPSQKKAKPS